MSKRNPMNERYGKHTAPAGKTRKSAAAAKPKRAAGTGTAPGAKKPARKTATILHPPTAEYKKFRTIWWVLLGTAIVLSTLAWWMWQTEAVRNYGTVVLVLSYVCLGGALWLDFTKLRGIRRAWVESGGKPDKAGPESDKQS